MSTETTTAAPPAPAPGQRWRVRSGWTLAAQEFTVSSVVGGNVLVVFDDGAKRKFGIYLSASADYLGPTPTETPSPARTPATALPPTLPAGAVAGVGGPPAGYVPCDRRGCVRWTYVGGGEIPCCWACFCGRAPFPVAAAQHPDWTPPADAPAKYAPSPFTVTSIDYGTDGRTVVSIIAAPAKPTHPAGITCPRCRCTSEGGAHHLEACPRGDFLPVNAMLTSDQWSAQVRFSLWINESRRLEAGRPFVPSIDDYDLFGKDVR